MNKQNRVKQKLSVLHKDAEKDFMRMNIGIVKSIFRPMQPTDFEKAYLPISREQGNTIRQIIVENNCKNIVEFGTSFGISTIYLADAARQIGGHVVTTELLESKAERAKQNILEAELNDYVEIRIGDAMETLKHYNTPIDFLLLDGWKNLYLPLFQMLEPLFHNGTIIYADNIDMGDTKNYNNYVLNKSDVYSSQLVHHRKAMLTSLI